MIPSVHNGKARLDSVVEHEVRLTIPAGVLHGTLAVPDHPVGVVLFAHGSGSSRFSARNRAVATSLHEAGFATLLLDLLTDAEEQRDRVTRAHRFDIPLLTERLVVAIDWLRAHAETASLPIGLFGASTGAAGALAAAALRPDPVKAVVSRGGRPDLAGDALAEVRAPTLLIVGGADEPVIPLNRWAAEHLRVTHRLAIVPRATHLFEEPGALERVAELAREWFLTFVHDGEDGRD